MKKTIIVQIIFIGLMMLGCSSSSVNHPTSQRKLVSDQIYYKIYKEQGRIYIVQNGKVLYKNLKYVFASGGTLYVLNEHNQKRVLKVSVPKENEGYGYPAPEIPIDEKALHAFTIYNTSTGSKITGKATTSGGTIEFDREILSIPKSKADRIFFEGDKSQLAIRQYGIPALNLYYQKDGRYGFLGKIDSSSRSRFDYKFHGSSNTGLYDKITKIDKFDQFLLKRGTLYGFWFRRRGNPVIEPKYASLGSFDLERFHLARFSLPDGRKGYVDTKGNEYYDEDSVCFAKVS